MNFSLILQWWIVIILRAIDAPCFTYVGKTGGRQKVQFILYITLEKKQKSSKNGIVSADISLYINLSLNFSQDFSQKAQLKCLV